MINLVILVEYCENVHIIYRDIVKSLHYFAFIATQGLARLCGECA